MKLKKILNFLLSLPRKPVLLLIIIYQKTISPDHGPLKFLFPHGYCKYYPTCSEYGRQAIEKGLVKGLFKTIWRIIRCNPWSRGGVDLP